MHSPFSNSVLNCLEKELAFVPWRLLVLERGYPMIVRCAGVHYWLIMLGQSRAWCSPEKHTPLTPDRKIKSDYSLVNCCCQFALLSFCVIISCRACPLAGLPPVFRHSFYFICSRQMRRVPIFRLRFVFAPVSHQTFGPTQA